MVTETWRPVLGYEGLYCVSSIGRVKSLPRLGTKGGILKPALYTGYCNVFLSKDGKVKGYGIHVLVAAAFIGPCPDGMEVNHKDFVTTNNWYGNLEYKTPKGNKAHSVAAGRYAHGEDFWSAKLSDSKVVEIRRLRNKGYTLKQLGKRFGVSLQAIWYATQKRSWRHVQ